MNYLSKNKESGFTLVELLIAMTIGLIILAALSSTFLMQRKTYDVQEQIVEMVQTARAAMDMMTREIRMAGYDPTGNDGFDEITITQDADGQEVLVIRADLNGGPGGSHERIRYKHEMADTDRLYQIRRATRSDHVVTGGTWTFQPFAENIQALAFEYLDENGVPLLTPILTADIRQIRITITARTSKADSDYTEPTYGDHYRRYTLTSFITPRNLAF